MTAKRRKTGSTSLNGQLDFFGALATAGDAPRATPSAPRRPSAATAMAAPAARPPTPAPKPPAKPAQPRAQVPSAILRVQEAALRVGLSVSTLNKMRCDGRGPRFIKLTGKTVGYAVEDLDAWVAERREQRGRAGS